jgi:hypothetical protein
MEQEDAAPPYKMVLEAYAVLYEGRLIKGPNKFPFIF